MSVPPVNGFYAFSTNVTKGFQATLTMLDANRVPYNFTGGNAIFKLTRASDNYQEFSFNLASGYLTLNYGGLLNINIPPPSVVANSLPNQITFAPVTTSGPLVPQVWIYVPEQYPYQLYNYELLVYDSFGNTLFDLLGAFTIYQF